MTVFDMIGLTGVISYVLAYALLQLEKVNMHSGRYLWLNAVGSVLILVSLYNNFNLPSMIAQVFWLFLTVYGFIRARAATKKYVSKSTTSAGS